MAILYGPLPPDSWAIASGADRVGSTVERLFARCVGDERCRTEFPSLEQEFRTMLTELDADPIRLNTRWGPIDVDGAVAQTVVAQALFDSGFLRYIPLAIRELRRRSAAFVEIFLWGVIGQGTSGGFYYAARCFELGPPLPADVLQQVRERYSWLGRSDRVAPDVAAVCDAFIPPARTTRSCNPFTATSRRSFSRANSIRRRHRSMGAGPRRRCPTPICSCCQARGTTWVSPRRARCRFGSSFSTIRSSRPTCGVAELPPLAFATNVHGNASVPRLMARLTVGRAPAWLIGTSLLLLSLLAGAVLLPVSWLAGRRTPRGRGAALASGLL